MWCVVTTVVYEVLFMFILFLLRVLSFLFFKEREAVVLLCAFVCVFVPPNSF